MRCVISLVLDSTPCFFIGFEHIICTNTKHLTNFVCLKLLNRI